MSVRSAGEAEAAVRGGATVVDVKEPSRGPLGRASVATWRAIRATVPAAIPVSVALGELADLGADPVPPGALAGIAFRKAGPAGLGPGWSRRWAAARAAGPGGPGWVAVIYADWAEADAPPPDDVIGAALAADDCPGVLVDSWDKAAGCPLTDLAAWADRVRRVQAAGRFVALAGRLDLGQIRRLAPLAPDLFAVRGAACVGGRRAGEIDPARVAELVAAAADRPGPVDAPNPGPGGPAIPPGRGPARG